MAHIISFPNWINRERGKNKELKEFEEGDNDGRTKKGSGNNGL